MKINPNFQKKNKKNKNNSLGVFNNKKSCLVDLKPLEDNKHREILKQEKDNKEVNDRTSKTLKVNIKIAKNYGFGTYFQNLRESIIDKFLNYDEYISFDGLFKFHSLNDLFNFSKENINESMSKLKQFPQNQSKVKTDNKEIYPPSTNITHNNHLINTKRNINYCFEDQNELEEEIQHKNQSVFLPIHNKIKQKHNEYFKNQSEFDFIRSDYNKENEFEIEFLKKNLESSKCNERTGLNSIRYDKGSDLNYQYFSNNPHFFNNGFNDSNYAETNNLVREHSRTKLMNLKKVKDYCSKRKMM